MAAREVYIRTVYKHSPRGTRTTGPDKEYILGLEWRQGDNIEEVRQEMYDLMLTAPRHPRDEMEAAFELEAEVKAAWPDRAYFMEISLTGDGDGSGWVQLFQPYGLPRGT